MRDSPLPLGSVAILAALAPLTGCNQCGEQAEEGEGDPRDVEDDSVAADEDAAEAHDGATGEHDRLADLSWYRAELDFGDELPALSFFLGVPEETTEPAIVKNGLETQEFEYSVNGDEVRFVAPWNYESDIVATRGDDGALEGRWRRYTPLWGEVIRGFRADPVEAPDGENRYPGEPAAVSVEGYWELRFDEHGAGQAHFRQDGDVVTGFVKAGDMGDSRFLTGNVRGNRLLVSTFNGNVANVVTADVSADGDALNGTLSMQDVWNEGFTGEKSPELEATSDVRLREDADTLSAPGLDRVEGKPALVKFFATWCPSCNDALPFITELADEYRPEGVEFLALQYDLNPDVEAAEEELAELREEYGFDLDVVHVPTTPAEWENEMPPELEAWDGLPIFAFLGPDGEVKQVWGGWYGPAAPEKNAQVRAKFEAWMQDLVALGS